MPVWISLLGSDLTMQLAKNYFHRARPEAYWYYHEVDFSFPSGHATISVAFYGALFYVIFRTRKKYASKFRWMIVGFFFVLLLGFSRLYLCVHYLSDVLAGYSLGLLWLLLAISMNEWILHRKKSRKQRTPNEHRQCEERSVMAIPARFALELPNLFITTSPETSG